ncbi:cytochrome c biogenesis protein [Actinoplanes sp. KI2]|uniref:cytochrome c biogenesis protein n=1 Tax=Actinoplanes sp. KI2 TaxID=2983315 RepID=UPI0021D58154|nr:cytochrome c biogenesis protein [Actinoplanes sp. KI2]MCU7730283.1 cytochrome c biogenesis protein [Actinoplanes sp. KI2]
MSDQPATPLLAGRHAARDRRTVGWAAAGLTAAGLLAGLTVAPPDAIQGQAQRLMYLHVPAAWTAYLAFFAVLIASGGVLIWADPRWDRAARAAAELGLAATAVAFLAGSLWGRLAWGVWWAWDPRIVSTVAMFLVYAAQLTVRRAYGERRAAWLGVAGFVIVPVAHFSVVWFRSLHQPATILAPRTAPPIDGLMLTALVICVLAATVTAGWLFLCRLAVLERRAGVPEVTSRRARVRP